MIEPHELPTAKELMNSEQFWMKRVLDQAHWTAKFLKELSQRTRPDAQLVLNSLTDVAQRCIDNVNHLRNEKDFE